VVNNKHQNDKLLLMSRYMTVFHILFWFLHGQQRTKRVKLFVTFSACGSRFTSAESEQPETRTYNSRSVPESSTVVYRLINHGIFVLVYTDKNNDHVRMTYKSNKHPCKRQQQNIVFCCCCFLLLCIVSHSIM